MFLPMTGCRQNPIICHTRILGLAQGRLVLMSPCGRVFRVIGPLKGVLPKLQDIQEASATPDVSRFCVIWSALHDFWSCTAKKLDEHLRLALRLSNAANSSGTLPASKCTASWHQKPTVQTAIPPTYSASIIYRDRTCISVGSTFGLWTTVVQFAFGIAEVTEPQQRPC